jgi:putative membrane protein
MVGMKGRPLRRIVEWLTVVAITGSGPAAAWAQERSWEWRWEVHPMWWMMGAWGIGMLLFMLIFWGLVIAGAIVGLRWFFRPGLRVEQDAAVAILRERYARGDIGKEEFEAKLRDLRG